ncbi:hypothetical protein FRC02_003266 [Tulasnella sp. 418]|nr:hypothetical protein FRC02_003266 [Tulasnella sp. 418]
MFGDNSWGWENMADYYTKIENNHYNIDANLAWHKWLVAHTMASAGQSALYSIVNALSADLCLLIYTHHHDCAVIQNLLLQPVDPQLTAVYSAIITKLDNLLTNLLTNLSNNLPLNLLTNLLQTVLPNVLNLLVDWNNWVRKLTQSPVKIFN